MSVDDIRPITAQAGVPFVPPLADYAVRSPSWEECEYHCFRDPSHQVLCAYWEGQPGLVELGPWPYDEVCVLLEGRVALIDEAGGRREFAAPEAFVVPRTFAGSWETIEPSRKVFVAIDTADPDQPEAPRT